MAGSLRSVDKGLASRFSVVALGVQKQQPLSAFPFEQLLAWVCCALYQNTGLVGSRIHKQHHVILIALTKTPSPGAGMPP